MGAPRYLKVCLMSMICSVAVLAATNSEPYVAVSTVACFLEYQSTGVLLTKWRHKTIAQNKMMSHPGMEMMNDALRCSRATQVHMEDLRLVNLTEICPNRMGECFKAPC